MKKYTGIGDRLALEAFKMRQRYLNTGKGCATRRKPQKRDSRGRWECQCLLTPERVTPERD
jgi:hypothetical protein